jgi:hypothetical protein
MFATVVRRLQGEVRGLPLRVDPRALKPDPAIVELTPGVAAAAPNLVQPIPDPLAHGIPRVRQQRSIALAQLGVAEGDIRAFSGCPGMLQGPDESDVPVAGCPSTSFAIAILALPREGGAWWPGSQVDERASSPAGVWSVRVIRREITTTGANMAAADYVLHRTADRVWTVDHVVRLLIAE